MTPAAPDTASHAAPRPSIAILGADALLAALPATPVQLAHACVLAGYQLAIPASWGDELIAAAMLRTLPTLGDTPAVQCSCPLVARRLLASGEDLRPFLISLVAPPVAAARYLRAIHRPAQPRITYVGRCPCATEQDMDARMSPEELLATFTDRGIVVEEQPHVFDSILPPDRRRFCSQPGGLPSVDALGPAGARRVVVELERGDLAVDLGQVLLSGRDVLVDLAPRLGCVCSGAQVLGVESNALDARTRLTALEPPRAPQPVVEFRPDVELELSIPAAAEPQGHSEVATALPVTRRADMRGAAPDTSRVAIPPDVVVPGARRRSPSRGTRAISTGAPAAREAGGRPLPRAYVAHRRSSPRGLRAVTETVTDSAPTAAEPAATALAPESAAVAPAVAPQTTPAAEPVAITREGEPMRLALLVAVLVLAGAVVGVVIGRWMR